MTEENNNRLEFHPTWGFTEIFLVMVTCWMVLLSLTTILEKAVFTNMDLELYGSRENMDRFMIVGLLFLSLAIQTSLFTLTYLIVTRRHSTPISKIGWIWCTHRSWYWRAALGGIAFGIAYYGFIVWILGGIPPGWRISGLSGLVLPLAFPVHSLMGICPAISEELFFRGFSYTLCRERFGNFAATMLSSGIFLAWHIPNLFQTVHYAVPIFVSGIILSVVFEKTRTLVPAMILHSFFNFTIVVLSYTLFEPIRV
jgi:membrane protease YdiL (CAAX protease family)